MYYCTIYQQLYGKLTPNSIFELFLCLSYSNKADAENCKQTLIRQALDSGGIIYSENNSYTILTGKLMFRAQGFTRVTSGNSSSNYKIGVEDDITKFSALPYSVKVSDVRIKDGIAFERYAEKVRRRKAEEKKANQYIANYNLAKFEKEIATMTDIYPVLRSFIRYAAQRTDKEALAQVVIKKIKELSEHIKI
jgi:F420-0:gamma-glutamyl ligase-like protein